jgi:hypothetical protein
MSDIVDRVFVTALGAFHVLVLREKDPLGESLILLDIRRVLLNEVVDLLVGQEHQFGVRLGHHIDRHVIL